MLLVPIFVLLAVQNPASAPAAARPDLLTAWSSFGGEPVLLVHFAGSAHGIRGFGIEPHDDVALQAEDMNQDGQTDITVRILSTSGQVLHHILLTDALPPLLDLGAGPAFTSLVSDEDNFGFGAAGVPCSTFDNSEIEDVGVFDVELLFPGPDAWAHDLGAFTSQLTDTAMVTLELRETFSDPGHDTKLSVESLLPFSFERQGSDCTGGCLCAFGTLHVFTGVLDDLSTFLDGNVKVEFDDGPDPTALDWSRLTILPL